MTPPNPDIPNGPASPNGSGQDAPGQNRNRIILFSVAIAVVVAVLIGGPLIQKANTSQITYNTFLTKVSDKQVSTATVDQTSGVITGTLTDGHQVLGQRAQPGHRLRAHRPQARSGSTTSWSPPPRTRWSRSSGT